MASKRIFVVDDDEMLCEMIKIHFAENSHHEVHSFNTGEDCLANMHLSPQIVILDFELNSEVAEAKNGLQVLEEIKEVDSNVCVIMLSSQSHYGKAAQTIVKGALGYVEKNDDAFSNIDKILASLN